MATNHLKNAKPIQDVESGNLWVIYGKSTSGKTTLLSTFPKPLLDLAIGDDGFNSIRDVEGVEYLKPSSFKEINDILDELLAHCEYAAVALDTFGFAVNEWVNDNVVSKKKKMTQQAWGEVKTDIEEIIRKCKLLSEKCIVILTLHEVMDTIEGMEDEITPDVRPNINKGARTYLEGMANFGIHTTVLQKEKELEDGTTKTIRAYAVHLATHPYYWVKTQKPKSIKVPDVMRNPTYDKIMAAISGE